MRVSSHSGLFYRIYPIEVSLILWVLPCYIRCHYYLTIFFFEDWLNHPTDFHFLKVGIATHLLLLLCGLAQPPKLFIYIFVDWHSHPIDYNFKDWHCRPSVHLTYCKLALPPNCNYSELAKPPPKYYLL